MIKTRGDCRDLGETANVARRGVVPSRERSEEGEAVGEGLWGRRDCPESAPEGPEGKCEDSKSSSCVLESFLVSSLPLSFARNEDVVCCDICKILVIRNRFKQHYIDRHMSGGLTNMIPFEGDVTTEDKKNKVKKVKRNRKKRSSFKEKEKYSVEILEKQKNKKAKIRAVNKRQHSKSFLESSNYFNNTKKLKLESKNIIQKQNYFGTDEGFMSSSPKLADETYYRNNVSKKSSLSFDVFTLNDGVYCSNDSVHRTSSESSTPPSLSLGTLNTLSSPSSLNILNDPSSVVTEHYFLLSNDLPPDRSGVSCKYQIDSLPWENFSLTQNKEDSINYSNKQIGNCFNLLPGEEDGEVERAVQSITNLFDLQHSDTAMRSQGFIDNFSHDKSKVMNTLNSEDLQSKSDMFNSEEASMIDCFLDEEFGNISANVAPSIRVHNHNLESILMEECNNLTEYQLDSTMLNSFSSDYDDKFETLINNAMNEFVSNSPQNVSSNLSSDRRKSQDFFDPLKHCGVVSSNGVFCHRSLLCKLHTMPQKRQVERPQCLSTLIKGIRDFNKTKKCHKKEAQCSNAFKSSNSSKTSSDSFTYNCSSTRSTEEACSFLDNRLSTPDLDVSVFNVGSDISSQTIINTFDHKPLTKSRFEQETVVNGSRTLVAMKSLQWRNRPKSNYHSLKSPQLSSLHVTRNGSHGDYYLLNSSDTLHLPETALSTKNTHDIFLPQMYTSHFGLSGVSNDVKCQIKTKGEVVVNGEKQTNNQALTPLSCQHSSRLKSNSMTCQPIEVQRTPSTIFVSNTDLTASSNSLNISTSAMNNVSLMSPGFFTSCNNQLVNINSHFINPNDLSSLNDVRLNANMVFNDQSLSHGGYSIANMSNNSSTILSDVSSSNNKFISILDEGANSGSFLYPVRNGNQIMMVMNKNNRVYNDNQDLFNDSFVSVNQTNNVNQQLTSMPLNSFLTLKQNTIKNIKQESSTSMSSPQIVSISPLELQRLSENLNNNFGGQLMTADCINTTNDKSNSLIYQLNQSQVTNNFASSSLVTKVDSNNMAKPLTVQSSTINGLTQKFVILPDGTISAFTQQPNNVKTTFNHLNRTPLQQPIFNQLSNYGQNQTYFINNDKIIIAPSGGISNNIAQQIIMPQLINQTDINSHSSALTFIQTQHSQSSKTQKINTRAAQNNLPTQIPVDSSQQKLSFQIQTQNQYSNQIPNTFFITAAHPAAGGNIPLKQPIFVQSADPLSQDVSLMDSSGYFEGQCNSQSKSVDSELRTISSSSQDFELINQVLNPKSIIIQQQPSVSRFSTKTMVQTNGCKPSLDINSVIEGAHPTTLSNGPQHIVINNNTSSDQFAHSQIKFSQMPMSSTSYLNGTSQSATLTNTQNTLNYKSGPPPLVISQQMLNQSVTNQVRRKSFSDHSYQPQSHQKTSQLNSQLVMDDSQYSNEYMIVQSMIA